MFAPQTELQEELRRLFSLPNLEKDPSLVLSMSPDLWVSIFFVCGLESIRRFYASPGLIILAARSIGCEYNYLTKCIRKPLDAQKVKIFVQNFQNVKEVRVALASFQYASIQKIKGELIVHCDHEEHGRKIMKYLVSLGKSARIEYVCMFYYLHCCVCRFLRTMEVIPFFGYERLEIVYTMEEIREMYESHVVERPEDYAKFSLSVIRKEGGPIKLLEQRCSS